jgi:hypothetical protein
MQNTAVRIESARFTLASRRRSGRFKLSGHHLMRESEGRSVARLKIDRVSGE